MLILDETERNQLFLYIFIYYNLKSVNFFKNEFEK